MGLMTSPASDSLQEILTRLDARVRSVDEERWLSSRYATATDRETLIVLYAFYYELARVRLAVSDETLGSIRFQWWRDALEELERGEIRQHDVAIALAPQIGRGALPMTALLNLIDRHADAFARHDRSVEPEDALVATAAHVFGASLDSDHPIRQIAQEWAALRRGDTSDTATPRLKTESALRPAVGHFRLRHIWRQDPRPGRLRMRLSVLYAILSGMI